MQIERFAPTHVPLIYALHESQGYEGLPSITLDNLPAIGFIALNIYTFEPPAQPLAAGFLRMVEGGFAQIDTLVTNGRCPPDVRHAAVSAVVDALVSEAKALKLRGIMATTKDAGVLKRAEALGFKIISQTLIGLNLI
jgi:hypothetical protein